MKKDETDMLNCESPLCSGDVFLPDKITVQCKNRACNWSHGWLPAMAERTKENGDVGKDATTANKELSAVAARSDAQTLLLAEWFDEYHDGLGCDHADDGDGGRPPIPCGSR